MPRKPMIDYGVSISLDSSGLVRGERDAKRVADRLTRNINKMRRAESDYQHVMKQLQRAFNSGKISRREYNREVARETLAVEKARNAQSRYEQQIQRQTRTVDQNTRAVARNNAARKGTGRPGLAKDLSNMGGNIGSMLGMGGAAAGGFRMLGLGVAGGTAGGVAVAGLSTLALIKSYKAYAKFEEQLTRLRVLFGKGLGTKLSEEFRELALNTALSRDAITESAIAWRSYGLSTDGITERMRRIGEVAGGNAAQMILLTRALAQVNNVGRLMGQERLQLLNAGFNLAEIAKVAGVEMSNFQKAMEEGRISAEHVNQALVNMTSKGGTHFGFLNEKAKTLNGRMEKLVETIDELFIALGEADKGFFAALITEAEDLVVLLRQAAKYWGMINGDGEISETNDPASWAGSKDNILGRPRLPGTVDTTADLDKFAGRDPSSIHSEEARSADLERRRREALQKTYSDLGRPNPDALIDVPAAPAPPQDDFLAREKANSLTWRNMVNGGAPVSAARREEYLGTQLPGQWVGGAIHTPVMPSGWAPLSPWALQQQSNAADIAEREAASAAGLAALGLTPDNTPPELKKILDDRQAAISLLDEQDANRRAGASLAAGGSAGAGQEYAYLAKQRKLERDREEQKKRDKERNKKLDEINERAKQQLADQLDTNAALRQSLANSGSV